MIQCHCDIMPLSKCTCHAQHMYREIWSIFGNNISQKNCCAVSYLIIHFLIIPGLHGIKFLCTIKQPTFSGIMFSLYFLIHVIIGRNKVCLNSIYLCAQSQKKCMEMCNIYHCFALFYSS